SDEAALDPELFERHQAAGFYSLVCLAQGLEKNNLTNPIRVGVVSSGLHAVSNEDVVCPSKSTLLGPCKVLPQEFPNLRCKSVDSALANQPAVEAAEQLLSELTLEPFDTVVAYRDGRRWTQEFERLPLGMAPADSVKLRRDGVYLITGGLGNIGLEFAEALA